MVGKLVGCSPSNLELNIVSNYDYFVYAEFSIATNNREIEDLTQKHHSFDNEAHFAKRDSKKKNYHFLMYNHLCLGLVMSLGPLLEPQGEIFHYFAKLALEQTGGTRDMVRATPSPQCQWSTRTILTDPSLHHP